MVVSAAVSAPLGGASAPSALGPAARSRLRWLGTGGSADWDLIDSSRQSHFRWLPLRQAMLSVSQQPHRQHDWRVIGR